jgi:type II secretory pathway component PulC
MLQNNTVQTHPSTLMTAKTSTVIGTQSRSNNGPTKLSQPPTPSKQVETTPIISVPIPVSLQQQSPSTNAVSRPVLTINGIAFQEGGSDNLAVINGITVSNGAVIEGIKVEDIQKDRVRFSHGGEKFEIILNKSNR